MKKQLSPIWKLVLSIGIPLLLFLLIIYTALPTISIFYFGSLMFIGFVLLAVAGIVLLCCNNIRLVPTKSVTKLGTADTVKVIFEGKRRTKVSKIIAIVSAGIILMTILLGFASTALFRSREYYGIIGDTVTTAQFEDEFEEVTASSLSQLINIDSSLAERKATTLFGEIRGFGSEYQLGMFTDQIVNGKFVTVAPIEYNGFFKYMANANEGTPGYVIVDKQNFSNDKGSEIVMDKGYRYMPSSYFGTDLMRHVYFSGYAGYEMTVSGFELDDDLNAHWVINIYQNKIYPLSGRMVTKILLVDPTTGELEEYDIDQVPDWVDNIQDSDTVIERVNQYGMYEDGYFNSIFAQTGVITSTNGSRHVVLDGQLYLYTGMTSTGADESISQLILVNKRTLQAIIYDVSGATEYVAMSSAEGKLQNYRYNATFPIPTNIAGVPTYFIPLKDDLGLVKHYSFVRIEDHTIIGTGDTVDKAYSNYLKLVSDSSQESLTTVDGVVERINIVGEVVYILVDGNIYFATIGEDLTVFLTQEGDSVQLKVSGSQIIGFTNNTLAQ